MAKYIDADTVVGLILFDDTCGIEKTTIETDTIENILDNFTEEGCPEPVDVVPASAYKQVMWERDVAVEQLKQIGKGLGEAMDDVALVAHGWGAKMTEYIRKADAIDAATQDSTENRTHSFRAGQARSASRIKALPTADVDPVVHGHWVYVDDDDMLYDTYYCSECHNRITVDSHRRDDIGFTIGDMKRCNRCGAKMDAHGEE